MLMRSGIVGGIVACALAAAPSTSSAGSPGTDGGPASRGCTPVESATIYVGATRVSCSIARTVVVGARRGRTFERWSCGRARRASFGHCHGRGIRSGATVHWAVND